MKRSAVASFSIPLETLKHTQEIAQVEKKSRSEVVSEALEKYYVMKQWEVLQKIGARQAKRLGVRSEDDVDRLIHEFRRNRK
jgi:metal-responsive CopG/Arc/MetJ family transcriptional regulator